MKIEYADGFNSSDPDVGFALYPEESLTSVTRQGLEELIRAWAKVGSLGGYGRGFHYVSELAFSEKEGQQVVEWVVDMGDQFNPMALEVLGRMLHEWARLQTWRDGQITSVGAHMKSLIVGTDFVG